MRIALACLSLALCAGLPASVSTAQSQQDNLAALQPPAAIEAEPALAPYAVADILARRLVPSQPPVEQAWLAELANHYAAPGARTRWVDRRGLTLAGRMAVEELRRADDYALDPSRFPVPRLAPGESDPRQLAGAEVTISLAVVRYAWHAKGGRLDPTQLSLWLDYKPKPIDAVETIESVLAGGDAAAGMRALHPRHFQFEALRTAYLSERGPGGAGEPRVSIPMGVRIKPGQRHPDVALARLRLDKPASDGDDAYLDSDFQAAIYEFMNNVAGIPYGRKRGIDDDVRVALNGGSRGGNRPMMSLIRANMERWRWLPHEFGGLYIWNNLPEFETRVVRDGEIIHRERIIIGQPSTQTPVFSDSMTRVIFNPDWSVPESIKLATIWPNLRGGDYSVLKRRGMRIVHEGREIDPATLNYASLDAKSVPVIMGPGPANPLGRFKFVFPNKHDVYMHDTTSKGLFESSERTFSHGCIRVRDPQRFAEVVLAEVKGWNESDIRWQTRAKHTVRVELDKAIPIHNTYFTLVADAAGTLKKLDDIYGHDKRVTDALNGVDVKTIAANDPAMAQKRRNEELANSTVSAEPDKPRKRSRSAKSERRKSRDRDRDARSSSESFFFSEPPPRPRNFSARSGLTRAARPRPRGFFFFW
jgi:murein L,D-transpeptidase YcbB/YkuD